MSWRAAVLTVMLAAVLGWLLREVAVIATPFIALGLILVVRKVFGKPRAPVV
jgi:energy-converting hydrogenase Eha subunit A